jgi:hypothetical protein
MRRAILFVVRVLDSKSGTEWHTVVKIKEQAIVVAAMTS